MLSPPRYLGFITNLPFWATWSLERIQNVDFFSPFMLGYVNKSNSSSTFPWILKLADITAVYKKDCRYEKGNYWPISFLPNLSKIFENVLYDQIFPFFENILSKYWTGFREGFMIEKFKKSLDQRGDKYAALFTELSKVFNCIPHDLIIAKLHTYGFGKALLRLMHSYLTGMYQRVKINNSYAFGASSNIMCLNVQFWVPYYLIYFHVICSSW